MKLQAWISTFFEKAGLALLVSLSLYVHASREAWEPKATPAGVAALAALPKVA